MAPRSTGEGFCLRLTDRPIAGKATISHELALQLAALGVHVELLDGEEVRKGLNADLGFDRAPREQHARRATFVAKLLARNGVIPIVALISPSARSRDHARQEVGHFVAIHSRTPIEVCEQRDVKGLYKNARAGQVYEFTGVDDPYEPPNHPEIVVDTTRTTAGESAAYVIAELEHLHWLPSAGTGSTPSTVPAH
jgi:adenylylsulfate kinase